MNRRKRHRQAWHVLVGVCSPFRFCPWPTKCCCKWLVFVYVFHLEQRTRSFRRDQETPLMSPAEFGRACVNFGLSEGTKFLEGSDPGWRFKWYARDGRSFEGRHSGRNARKYIHIYIYMLFEVNLAPSSKMRFTGIFLLHRWRRRV